MEKKWIFSLVSGELFQIEEDEIKTLFNYQLPLLKKPSGSCDKCYGRGYKGIESRQGFYIPCMCVLKNVDKSNIKGEHIDLHMPRFN